MKVFFFSIHSLSLIYAQRRAKLKKYLNYLQYRKGILGKITKTWSKGGQKDKKSRSIFAPFYEILDFPAFFALLSFWFLIYNAEFDLNSMFLDRLDKFGINRLQKLQNKPQNAISRIAGTLIRKLG